VAEENDSGIKIPLVIQLQTKGAVQHILDSLFCSQAQGIGAEWGEGAKILNFEFFILNLYVYICTLYTLIIGKSPTRSGENAYETKE
jgi:hypothetical protein